MRWFTGAIEHHCWESQRPLEKATFRVNSGILEHDLLLIDTILLAVQTGEVTGVSSRQSIHEQVTLAEVDSLNSVLGRHSSRL